MKFSEKLAKYFVILFIIVFYLFIINIFPGYFFDDFTIHKIIKLSDAYFSQSPSEKYYLFFRPVSYFFFKIDHTVLNFNYFLSKILSLTFLAAFSLILFFVLLEIQVIFKYDYKKIDTLLIVLFVSTHVTFATSIIWVADRNEIVMCFFYISSILFFLKYIRLRQNYFLLFVFVLYLLSVLAKQQSLHLPIILIVIKYYFNGSIYSKSEKIFFGSTFFTMIFLILINYFVFSSSNYLFEYLWKKPFWVVNASLFTFFPFFGDLLYKFFLSYKIIALLLIVAASIFVSSLIYLKKCYSKFYIACSIYLVTFIPIIGIEFSPRVISISIIIISLLLFIYSYNIKQIKYYRIFFALIIFANLIYTATYTLNLKDYILLEKRLINELVENDKYQNGKKLVFSPFGEINNRPYISLNSFDSAFIPLPIYMGSLDFYLYNAAPEDNYLFDIKSNSIMIYSRSDDYFILNPPSDTIYLNNMKLIVKNKDYHRQRFLKSLEIYFNNIDDSITYIIYLNGTKWEYLKLPKSSN